jgi:formylglycine-generating enzyme required for sulfatase activity
MVVVPAGSFTMGSSQAEPGHRLNEAPQHNVTIEKSFAVSKFVVTFVEWDACAAHGDCVPHVDDHGWGRDRQPVINVSWDNAQRYVTWLSKITGKTYRLLTEAEYEYAARADTRTAYPWGDDIGNDHTNCADCGSRWDLAQAAPVGSFAPNKFGLYEMVGNVWEWVEDCLHEDYRGAPADGSAWMTGDCGGHRLRGGSWASLTRSALLIVAVLQPAIGTASSVSGSGARSISRTPEVSSWPMALALCLASSQPSRIKCAAIWIKTSRYSWYLSSDAKRAHC